MDAFLAIASKRDVRDYADRPIPDEVRARILDAGRLAGSARNRQPWRFLVVESAERRDQLAEAVYEPRNVRGAAVVVAIVTDGGTGALDVGRAMQNMFLAAWNDGFVSCPNGVRDADAAAAALSLEGDEKPVIILSFGYPARPRDPESRPASDWSRRANRKALEALVRRL